MRLLACSLCVVLVCVVMACGGGDDAYPIKPGGGHGTGTDGRGDGAADAGGDGSTTGTINGHVCVMTDSRSFGSCKADGLAGIVVKVGSYAATTNDVGDFSITKVEGAGLYWTLDSGASGIKIVRSIVPLAQEMKLRVMLQSTYDDIIANYTIAQDPLRGAAFLEVSDGTDPLPGATVATASTAAILYDGQNVNEWDLNGPTLANGTAWLQNVNPTGNKMLVTVTRSDASQVPNLVVPVVAGRVTFASLNTAGSP